MAAIHTACFPPEEAWDAAAMATLLGMPGCLALIDPEGGLAMGRVAADEMEVLTLAVLAPLRRQGRGGALLRALADAGAARGAGCLFLEVAAANAALRLYERAGFARVGRRGRYYRDGSDAVVLRATLPLGGAGSPPG
jgi:ribosomal-protein-alanine N-acetyltransferase